MDNYKSIIMNFLEWLKSFLSEPVDKHGFRKGSTKRVIMLVVTYVFAHSYFAVSLSQSTLVDIPTNWMMIISGMIGLGILDKKTNKEK